MKPQQIVLILFRGVVPLNKILILILTTIVWIIISIVIIVIIFIITVIYDKQKKPFIIKTPKKMVIVTNYLP